MNVIVYSSEPEKCGESLTNHIPASLLTSSGLTEKAASENLTMGSTLDLACPDGLQLSKDDDGFDPLDNRYTVLCTTRYVRFPILCN